MLMNPSAQRFHLTYLGQEVDRLVAVATQQRQILAAVVLMVAVEIEMVHVDLLFGAVALAYFAAAMLLGPQVNRGLAVFATQVCQSKPFAAFRGARSSLIPLLVPLATRSEMFSTRPVAFDTQLAAANFNAFRCQSLLSMLLSTYASTRSHLRQVLRAMVPPRCGWFGAGTTEPTVHVHELANGDRVQLHQLSGFSDRPRVLVDSEYPVLVSRTALGHGSEPTYVEVVSR